MKNGIDLSETQRGEEPTTLGFVKTAPGADPEYAFYASGTADCSFNASELPRAFPDTVEAIAFGSISLLMEPGATVIEKLIEREKNRRVLSFDPNIRPGLVGEPAAFLARCERLFTYSTIVKLSDMDLRWLYPELSLTDAAEKVLSFGPSLVAVTKGAAGSFALAGGLIVECASVPVEVVDTVGAGDTFHAGLIARLSGNGLLTLEKLRSITAGQLNDALSYAARCAAVTCTRSGANPPFADEVK